MGVTNSNKQIHVDHIDCDGTLKVTLALSAAPDIVSNPAGIVLVLDRSGSMAGSPLANMKMGQKLLLTSSTKPPTAPKMGKSALAARSVLSAFPIPLPWTPP